MNSGVKVFQNVPNKDTMNTPPHLPDGLLYMDFYNSGRHHIYQMDTRHKFYLVSVFYKCNYVLNYILVLMSLYL